jgi:tRNA nucleotidyltransferase (CCA-adding enzyme)
MLLQMEESMKTRIMNPDVERMAERIIDVLHREGFIIQRYNSMTTNSIYLKLDYGVCNSIRISDHEGKPGYCYRYNLILGGETNIIEEKFIRYYFNEKNFKELVQQIAFDKMCKLNKYGNRNYNMFMQKNRDENDGKKGFWSNARLLKNPHM